MASSNPQAELWFRCAKTGEHFTVSFMRYSPAHRFQISGIRKERPSAGQTTGGAVREQSYSSADFDFSGFYCPCCGHARNEQVPSLFVRCGKCRDLVCGGRVRKLAPDRVLFACHDECGGGGEVSGQIESYTSATQDSPAKHTSGTIRQGLSLPSLPPSSGRTDVRRNP